MVTERVTAAAGSLPAALLPSLLQQVVVPSALTRANLKKMCIRDSFHARLELLGLCEPVDG